MPNINFSKMFADLKRLQESCCGSNIAYSFDNCLSLESKFVALLQAVLKLLESNKELAEDYEELYNYVHDYFNNLDVQTEINNKIDAMLNDGSLEDILREIFHTQKSSISPLSALIVSFDIGTTKYHWENNLFYTQDGINYKPILELPNVEGASSGLWYDSNWIYKYSYNNSISDNGGTVKFQTSKNLYDWNTTYITVPGVTDTATFSNPGNIFEYNNQLYYCFYTNNSTKTEKNPNGDGMSIYLCKISFNNGIVNIGEAKEISPNSHPNIDPFIWNDNSGLHMMYRTDQPNNTAIDGVYYVELNNEFMTTTEPLKLTCFCDDNGVNACEYPSVMVNENYISNGGYRYYVYADDWSGRIIGYPAAGMVVAVGNNIATLQKAKAINTSSINMRGGTVFPLKQAPQLLDIINQYRDINPKKSIIYSQNTGMLKADGTFWLLPNSDNMVLINRNITIKKFAGLRKGESCHIVLPTANYLKIIREEGFSNFTLPNSLPAIIYAGTDTETTITVTRAGSFEDSYYFSKTGDREKSFVITDTSTPMSVIAFHKEQPQFFAVCVNENYLDNDRVAIIFYTIFNKTLFEVGRVAKSDTLKGVFSVALSSESTTENSILSINDSIRYTKIDVIWISTGTVG